MNLKIKTSFFVYLAFHIALTLIFTFVYYRLSQDEFEKHFNGSFEGVYTVHTIHRSAAVMDL